MTAQASLFETEPSTKPECKLYDERFDWHEAFCKERYATPDDWQIYRWSACGRERNAPGAYIEVEGAVFKTIITKGKRKGRPDYKKPEPNSTAKFAILITDLDQFQIEWSAKTGKCANCYGTGQEWNGWHHKTGNKFRDCHACKATGNAAHIGKGKA